MHPVYHPLRVLEILVEEVHGVPEVVASPVLPVLHHAVHRYALGAVALEHAEKFGAALVPLAALHEAVAPQREHGHMTREVAYRGDHSVGVATVYEVVVNAVSDLRLEGHPVIPVAEQGRRRVVPKDAVALYGLHDGRVVVGIALYHLTRLSAQREVLLLDYSEAVEVLSVLGQEGLAHYERTLVESFRTLGERMPALAEQQLSGREHERHLSVGIVHPYAQRRGSICRI